MKKNIVIAMLTIMVIGLVGYIAYDKLLNKQEKNEILENKTETDKQKEDNNNGEINDSAWLDYLLEQEFVSASLSVCSIDGKFVYDKDSEWQPNPGTGRDINKAELNKILTTIYESENNNNSFGEIVKSYGYAVPACADLITYKYIHNGKEYNFSLNATEIMITDDKDLIKILNNHLNEYTNYALNKDNKNYQNLVKEMMEEYIRY